MKLRVSDRRIGVLGLPWSGKTVLLTSLIDHLNYHDPAKFWIADPPAGIVRFREQDTDRGWKAFPYAQYRKSLSREGTWPSKTMDRSQFVCRFERSDWKYQTAELRIYDLPGERFSDAGMLSRNFADWSAATLHRLESSEESRFRFADFLGLLERDTKPDREELIWKFKVGLARALTTYELYISPSTFLLDTKGSIPSNPHDQPQSPENIAKERLLGLSEDSQFIPLPPGWRSKWPDLYRPFSESYQAYKEQIVLPVFKAIRSCHGLIVLLDVLHVLSAGVAMYNSTQRLIENVLETLNPGQSIVGQAVRAAADVLPHWMRPGGITRVAFVATKLDLVPPEDHGKLCDLLKSFVKKAAENCEGADVRFLACSAIVASKTFLQDETTGEYSVIGRGKAQGTDEKYPIFRLPDGWPEDFEPGMFQVPYLRPVMPAIQGATPKQVGLDDLFRFMMSWSR